MHEMSNPIFCENEKNSITLLSAEFAHSLLSFSITEKHVVPIACLVLVSITEKQDC